MKTYRNTSELFADRFAIEVYGISHAERCFQFFGERIVAQRADLQVRKVAMPDGIVSVIDVDDLAVSGG